MSWPRAHDNYERKSPQRCAALWNISSATACSFRTATPGAARPLVSDIVHKNRVPTFGLTMEAVDAVHGRAGAPARLAKRSTPLSEMAELTAEIIAAPCSAIIWALRRRMRRWMPSPATRA